MRRCLTARYLSVLLTSVTLVFIFIQSLLPPTVSGAESGWVATLLGDVFGETTVLGRFLIEHVRKIAHFLEYGALGAETLWLLYAFREQLPLPLCRTAPLWGLAVGFVDETLQCFSSRGPAIADVWLDGAGFATGFLLGSLLLLLPRRKRENTDA